MKLEIQNRTQQRVYSITELTRQIKFLLESHFPNIWVKGEISNFKLHSSGHMYFSLKDENAQLPCVMWRGRNNLLFFMPKDGMKVVAQGNVTVYEKRGYYQFEVLELQPAGIGELQLAFEQLKQRLKAEGLFEAEHKKPIPAYPERIGIVTSATGAAIRDLVTVVGRRFPSVQLILNPVRVQGDGAAEDIARAIDEFNEYGQVDVLIVGRGGGSLEDLWPFNEEVVARAIFRSKIPIISAVGHEVDFSISDFVADLRAPTPSAAAELVVRNRDELLSTLQAMVQKMYRLLKEKIRYYRDKVNYLESSYALRRPADVIKEYNQRLDELTRTMETALTHQIERERARITALTKHLENLNPLSIMKRGYSICYREQDGHIIIDAVQLQKEDKIRVQFAKGQIRGTVDEVQSSTSA
ncbi:exodeoxyribonuclease VII large subunit [candidate division KSB1 bacterium 4484_219]|nr:MAG: exodeoxyribonuclease VII large subunit [candidate division KSB1 bacterium 4484_219]